MSALAQGFLVLILPRVVLYVVQPSSASDSRGAPDARAASVPSFDRPGGAAHCRHRRTALRRGHPKPLTRQLGQARPRCTRPAHRSSGTLYLLQSRGVLRSIDSSGHGECDYREPRTRPISPQVDNGS